MPTYDYFCHDCQCLVSIFWRSIKETKEKEALCPKCGNCDLERRVSPFRHLRAGKAANLPIRESDLQALEHEDPKAMARLFRRMSKEMGEQMEAPLEEVVDRLEKGDDPEKIEKELHAKDD